MWASPKFPLMTSKTKNTITSRSNSLKSIYENSMTQTLTHVYESRVSINLLFVVFQKSISIAILVVPGKSISAISVRIVI